MRSNYSGFYGRVYPEIEGREKVKRVISRNKGGNLMSLICLYIRNVEKIRNKK